MKEKLQEKIRRLSQGKSADLKKGQKDPETRQGNLREITEYLGWLVAFITARYTTPFANANKWLDRSFCFVSDVGIVVCGCLIVCGIFRLREPDWWKKFIGSILALPGRILSYIVKHKKITILLVSIIILHQFTTFEIS